VRVVFDANILVRAFVTQHGSANLALRMILSGNHSLVLSREILQETIDVVRRPRLQFQYGGSDEQIYDFVSWLRQGCEIVTINFLHAGPVRDAGDAYILQTALTGNADAICTLDRDFFTPPASEFLKQRGIEVLTDVQLLQRLRQ
jgi:putative PIN family toxin of toxin-antitoxin system